MKPLLQTRTSKNDAHFIDIGDIRLPIKITKRRNSRRLVVRYQPIKKSLSLTLPQATSIKQGLHFVNEKREWIEKQLMQYANPKPLHNDRTIPIFGKEMRIEHIGGRGLITEEYGVLKIHGDIEFMARRIKKYLIDKLKSEISMLAKNNAATLGARIGSITLRDTSSRWGSCSFEGNLSFSWRLVFAPYEIVAYVVAHEVAHIREHNHSPAFWKLVAGLCPNYMESEDWLKKNGKTLYSYNIT